MTMSVVILVIAFPIAISLWQLVKRLKAVAGLLPMFRTLVGIASSIVIGLGIILAAAHRHDDATAVREEAVLHEDRVGIEVTQHRITCPAECDNAPGSPKARSARALGSAVRALFGTEIEIKDFQVAIVRGPEDANRRCRLREALEFLKEAQSSNPAVTSNRRQENQ
jgi:hypothetical protein